VAGDEQTEDAAQRDAGDGNLGQEGGVAGMGAEVSQLFWVNGAGVEAVGEAVLVALGRAGLAAVGRAARRLRAAHGPHLTMDFAGVAAGHRAVPPVWVAWHGFHLPV
jgi:hypothetical protein